MRVISNVSQKKWDEIVRYSTNSTFFQTWTWANILKNSFGFEIATKLYLFDDGVEILLPLMKTFSKFGIFVEYVSIPLAYGGFVSNPTIDKERVQEILTTFGSNEAVVIGPHPLTSNLCSENLQKLDFYTHILWLEGNFDEVWNHKVKKKRRNRCRKARELGVVITEDCSLNAFEEYYSIYHMASLARRQANIYPKSLFEEMARSKSRNIKLWLAKLDHKTIAGSIVFYNHEGLFNWSESTIADFAHDHPASALVERIIEDACNRGYKYVDFGGSLGEDGRELEGVRQHKESFGAQRVNYSAYRWEGKLFQFGRQISRLARRTWSENGRQ